MRMHFHISIGHMYAAEQVFLESKLDVWSILFYNSQYLGKLGKLGLSVV